MNLNIDNLLVLLAEILFVAGAALILFRFRNRISLAPLFIFVGTNQFLGVVLAATVYLVAADSILVSPGSMVLFTSYMFVILLVYLRTDIPTTRGLIYGIVVANSTLTMLLWITSYQLREYDTQLLLDVTPDLFSVSPWVYMVGTLMLVVDSVLIIVIYELLAYRARWLPLLFRISMTLGIVLLIDAVVFAYALAAGEPYFQDVLRGQIFGKLAAGMVYSLVLYGYLSLLDPKKRDYQAPVLSDIFSILTHRERYHQVKQQLEVSEAGSEAKSRFLTNVSHELRTPLNAIIGFTTILVNRHEGSDEELNFLQRVLENGKHLLALINGLLDLSKIESGKVDLTITQVDISALMKETMEQLQGEVGNRSISLRVEAPPKPALIETDQLRFKQILINLMGNALKFTHEGEVTARLTADPGSGKPARLDIVDSGSGIAENDLEAIFEPFYQQKVHEGDSRGTGLGLAISRALCHQMNLKLSVTSNLGKGSQFSIIF